MSTPENGEEAQEVVVPQDLKPVVFGPPSHGSQDPNTSAYTLLPIEDLPEMVTVENQPAPSEGEQPLEAATANVSKDDLLEIAEMMEISEDDVNADMEKSEIVSSVLSSANLNRLNKDELEKVAETLGMEDVTTSMTKTEMVAAIRGGGQAESVAASTLDTPGRRELDVNPNA
jgi:hypothetical protein